METLTKHEIAKHLGVDHTRVRGAQDWVPDTHPHLRLSQLVLEPADGSGNAEIHPFRVHNAATGETHTRLAHEREHILDHDRVKALHADTLALNQKKNREVVPLIIKAIPELDQEDARFVRIGANVYDFVDGKLLNPRPIPHLPGFGVDNGQIVVDVSAMAEHHQNAIADALRAKPTLALTKSTVGG